MGLGFSAHCKGTTILRNCVEFYAAKLLLYSAVALKTVEYRWSISESNYRFQTELTLAATFHRVFEVEGEFLRLFKI